MLQRLNIGLGVKLLQPIEHFFKKFRNLRMRSDARFAKYSGHIVERQLVQSAKEIVHFFRSLRNLPSCVLSVPIIPWTLLP